MKAKYLLILIGIVLIISLVNASQLGNNIRNGLQIQRINPTEINYVSQLNIEQVTQNNEPLATFKLIYNTKSCGNDMPCFAVIKADLINPTINLLNSITFNDLTNGDTQDLDYDIKVSTDDMKTWVDYDSNTEYSDTVYIRITANKEFDSKIDWILTALNVDLSDWAVWGNVYTYDNYVGTSINWNNWVNYTNDITIASFSQDSSTDVAVSCSSQNVCSPGCVWHSCSDYIQTNQTTFPDFNSLYNLTARITLSGSGNFYNCYFSAFGNTIVTSNNGQPNTDEIFTFTRNYSDNNFAYYNQTNYLGEITPTNNILKVFIGTDGDTGGCTNKIYIINYTYGNQTMRITTSPQSNYHSYNLNNVVFSINSNTTINQLSNITLNINSNNTFISQCYQEQANTSSSSDGNCNLNYTGLYSLSDNFNDADFNTFVYGSNDYYINYSKPINSTSAIWKIKTNLGGTYNLNILNSCFTYSNKLLLREVHSHPLGVTYYNNFDCFDGNWQNLVVDTNSIYDNLYEEAINWNVPVNNFSLTKNISGTINNSIFNITLPVGLYNWNTYVCDNDNNCKYSNTNNLVVNPFNENLVSYTTPVLEGQLNVITANFTTNNTINSITLNYNGTSYTPTISIVNGNYIVNSSVLSPSVSSNTNISFYYTININGTNYISNSYNQSVNNIALTTNCTSNYNVLNISNFDEESLNSINGTVEYIIGLQNSNSQVTTLSGNATGTNLSLCSDMNLSNSYLNYVLQLRYYDLNGYYFVKTYNIQPTSNSNLPLNINLYYLNKSIGTSFKINYVDFNYLTYPNAIMQIQRQYIPTDSYNIVEIPQLDNNGNAVGSFDTNNIRYKIIVINQGVVLDTFNDVFPVCQNIVLGECDLNLRGNKPSSTSTSGDFTYTLVKTNTSLVLTYIIPSGTPRNIEFLTNQNSRFLNNITTCDTSIFASGGTISCPYNQTVGDSIISTQIINSDGTVLYGSVGVSQDLSGFFMLNNYFIAFILMLLLALIFVSSGTMQIIVGVIGLLFLGIVFLLNGANLFTTIGSLSWLIIGAVIIIYKISQKEDRT